MSEQEAKKEWQNKMWRYYVKGGVNKDMAVHRVTIIANDTGCWDWDDNVPQAWALELAKKWELELT